MQVDITALPFADGAFDLVYSLGVLHHLEEPQRGMAELARVLRDGGTCLVYLYYALDNRGTAFKAIARGVDVVRRVLSIAPQPVLVTTSTAIAALVYFPLARVARMAEMLGLRRVATAIPLSYYSRRSFRTMRNDSLDRFGTRLERRFTKEQLVELMRAAGLEDIRVSNGVPYWHATGVKPAKGR